MQLYQRSGQGKNDQLWWHKYLMITIHSNAEYDNYRLLLLTDIRIEFNTRTGNVTRISSRRRTRQFAVQRGLFD